MRIEDFDNITELISDKYVGIVLSDANDLRNMEYRILAGQNNKWGAKLYKCFLNGQIELFYLTNEYKKLGELLPGMAKEQVYEVIRQICESILGVTENNFLERDALLLDLDKLFFDIGENRVKFIYLPVNCVGSENHRGFSEDLYSLIHEIARRGNCDDISASLIKLKEKKGIMLDPKHILGVLTKPDNKQDCDTPSKNRSERRGIRLSEIRGDHSKDIIIEQEHFIIGRKADAVDGVIPNNKLVGRIHCRIDLAGDKYTVTDLKSLNGTYVNDKRLKEGENHPLKKGDVLKIANMEYKVMDL